MICLKKNKGIVLVTKYLFLLGLIMLFLVPFVLAADNIELVDIKISKTNAASSCLFNINDKQLLVQEKVTQQMDTLLIYVNNVSQVRDEKNNYDICKVVITYNALGRKFSQSARNFIKDRSIKNITVTARFPVNHTQIIITQPSQQSQIGGQENQIEQQKRPNEPIIEDEGIENIEQTKQQTGFWRWLSNLIVGLFK